MAAATASSSKRPAPGIPLLCLHTAGADSRQFRHLLNDTAVTSRYRVIAFDMPYHGRTESARRLVAREIQADDGGVPRVQFAPCGTPRARASRRPRVLDGRRHRPEAGRRIPARTARCRRPRNVGLCAGALQRVPAPPGDSRRGTRRELYVRTLRADEPGAERPRELVVLQPVRARRVRRRRALLQQRLGRPRGRQADRHAASATCRC